MQIRNDLWSIQQIRNDPDSFLAIRHEPQVILWFLSEFYNEQILQEVVLFVSNEFCIRYAYFEHFIFIGCAIFSSFTSHIVCSFPYKSSN